MTARIYLTVRILLQNDIETFKEKLSDNLLWRKLFHYGSATQKCEANKPLKDVTTGPIF